MDHLAYASSAQYEWLAVEAVRTLACPSMTEVRDESLYRESMLTFLSLSSLPGPPGGPPKLDC